MVDQGLRVVDLDKPLQNWRQGDFALDVGGFLFANTAEDDGLFDAEQTTENIVGLIVISQSCDIVRRTGGRFHLAVCPLIKVPSNEISAIQKGRRPYLTEVENAAKDVFADLRRVMSVHKNVVHTWKRQAGFTNDITRRRFAAALERKFRQFAFPDEFDQATKQFRERVWSRYCKIESEPGKVYRSLVQIRFCAEPNWTAERRKIKVVAIMKDLDDCEVDRTVICKELSYILGKIKWPNGYEWGNPDFILGTAKDFTAEDIFSSQRGDFDYLCY